jgi:hypothetical protein
MYFEINPRGTVIILYTVSNKQENTETAAIVAMEEMWIAMVTYALLEFWKFIKQEICLCWI